MKVLLLNALDIYGGGEFFVYQFASILKKRGHEVWVSCRSDNPIKSKCEKINIPVFEIDYPRNYGKTHLIRITRKLIRFIKENKIELVHSNTNYDRTAGAFAAYFSGIAHVTTNHSFHSIEYNLTHWLRNKYLTNRFIVDGQCTKDLLLEDDTISEDKISLIHLGIEPGTMVRDELFRKQIRKEFGLNENEILIGNVGRMVPFKGQEYIIKAYAEVNQKYPDTRLMVVGSGEQENLLKALTVELHLTEKVIFPGFRDDMQAVYSAFDIYAHTSVEGGGETFPYACLYALAQGLPLVVTKVGDVPAMVEDGVNGFVVEDKNPELISEKLSLLIKDTEMRNRFGKESLRLLKEKFTENVMADKIEEVYKKAIETGKKK